MWYHYFFFPEGENEAQSPKMLGLRSPSVTSGVSAAEGRQLTSNLLWAEWSFLVGVIQPTSFSNFPPAGAVPPVFPCVAQQRLQRIGCSCSSALTPELKPYLPQACVQHNLSRGHNTSTAKHLIPCVCRTSCIPQYQERQYSRGEGKEGGTGPASEVTLGIRALHGLPRQP